LPCSLPPRTPRRNRKPRRSRRKCPVEHTIETIEDAIGKAAALEIFQACSYTASGDVPLGEAVIKRCEGDFAPKLSAAQRKSYDAEIKRCWQKYRRESGTMYRSFEAFCAAGVAQNYSRRVLKGSAPKRAK
jgi:hypothetical protein